MCSTWQGNGNLYSVTLPLRWNETLPIYLNIYLKCCISPKGNFCLWVSAAVTPPFFFYLSCEFQFVKIHWLKRKFDLFSSSFKESQEITNKQRGLLRMILCEKANVCFCSCTFDKWRVYLCLVGMWKVFNLTCAFHLKRHLSLVSFTSYFSANSQMSHSQV